MSQDTRLPGGYTKNSKEKEEQPTKKEQEKIDDAERRDFIFPGFIVNCRLWIIYC
jgi:hypothetical protein